MPGSIPGSPTISKRLLEMVKLPKLHYNFAVLGQITSNPCEKSPSLEIHLRLFSAPRYISNRVNKSSISGWSDEFESGGAGLCGIE